MKKFIQFSILILLWNTNSYSQYLIHYNHIEILNDSNGGKKKVSKQYLYSLPEKSKYVYNQKIDGKMESIVVNLSSETQSNEEVSSSFEERKETDSLGSILIKNFNDNILRRRSLFPIEKAEYVIIQQEMPELNWKISNEVKIIGDYKCQKAYLEYLGRNYEAWFTSEIEIQDGPSFFYGLPGLIIQLNTVDQLNTYLMTKLELYKKSIGFDLPNNVEKTYHDLHDEITHKFEKIVKYKKAKDTDPDGHFSISVDIPLFPIFVFGY